ncbi:MAG TPA: hypothetical protein VIW29_13250 [Polyangiaceae bacterium]
MNLLALASLVAACGGAAAQAAQPAPAPTGSSSAAPAARASSTAPVSVRCSATPSTVYGDEPVSFSVEGEAAAGTALDATLYAASGRVVARTTTRVPGQLQLRDVPSGDFSLLIGAERVSCAVTVNRELSRATSDRN